MTHNKKKYNSDNMPFSIYSSSVSTGYAFAMSEQLGNTPTSSTTTHGYTTVQKMYWTTPEGSTTIGSASISDMTQYSGTVTSVPAASSLKGVAFDSINQKLYWTITNGVFSSSADGSSPGSVVSSLAGNYACQLIVVPSLNKIVYNYDTYSRIGTASLDGEDVGLIYDSGADFNGCLAYANDLLWWVEEVGATGWQMYTSSIDALSTVPGPVGGISASPGSTLTGKGAVDTDNEKIYWSVDVGTTGYIYSCSFDATGFGEVISSTDYPQITGGLVVHGGFLYFSDLTNDKVYKSNLDGTGIVEWYTEVGLGALCLGPSILIPITSSTTSISSSGFDVTNLHEDTYGGIKDAPMQGPFTYQYVGGNQHRHIPLNDGTDRYWNRPELFDINLSSSGEIRVVNSISPSLGVTDLADTGGGVPKDIALDIGAGKMYWVEYGTKLIKSANMSDGGDVTTLVTVSEGLDNPQGIAVDPTGGKMYWVDPGVPSISRADLDGSNIEALVTTTEDPSLNAPQQITLDIAAGKMYWTDPIAEVITRADLDGSNIEDLVTAAEGIDLPAGIDLDIAAGKMYWTDYTNDEIMRSNLDGSDIETLVTTETDPLMINPTNIALYPLIGKMYWSDFTTGATQFKRANLDGSFIEVVIPTDLGLNPRGFAIDTTLNGKIYIADADNKIYSIPPFRNRPVPYTRGEVAKRPLNIANHKTYNPLGNFTYDYEVIQTVGRTSNNRAFVEAEGVGFIGDPTLPYSGSLITQFVSGARDPLTGTALPVFGSNETVFVNRFNAPGGPDVSSRGVLDTYAEEFAPNNEINIRNNAVRSQLRSQLAAYTPKPGSSASNNPPLNDPFDDPSIATRYHSDYRNPKYHLYSSPTSSIEVLVPPVQGPYTNSIALDSMHKKLYYTRVIPASGLWVISTDDIAPFDSPIMIADHASSPFIKGGASVAVDPSANKIYVGNQPSAGKTEILRGNLDGTDWYLLVELPVPVSSGVVRSLVVDKEGGYLYYLVSDYPGGHSYIGRVLLEGTGSSPPEDLVTGMHSVYGLTIDKTTRMMYFYNSHDTWGIGGLFRTCMDGTSSCDTPAFGPGLRVGVSGSIERVTSDSAAAIEISNNPVSSKIYYANPDGVFRANLETGGDVEMLIGPNETQMPFGMALDLDRGKMYWGEYTTSRLNRSSIPDYLVYDNAYVSHEIPQADLDYSWIRNSALTTYTELPGHQNSSSVPYGPYTDIDFVLDSGLTGTFDSPNWYCDTAPWTCTPGDYRGDFIGISGSGVDKSEIEVLTPLGSTNFLSKSANTIFNVYNGPYQYPSWQQVRNFYNPIVRQLVEQSILSLADVPPLLVNSIGQQTRALRGGVTNFKEPVVSGDSKPIMHDVFVQPNASSAGVTSSFTYTYNNNLSSFTNVDIRNRLNSHISDEGSVYENLSTLYLDHGQLNDDTNPVKDLISLDYSQVLYPAPLNAFLNETRTRTNYVEVAGTGSDGYDRRFGSQQTFFKEVPAEGSGSALVGKIRTYGVAPNSQGFVASPGATVLYPDGNHSYAFSSLIFDTDIFTKDASSGMVLTPDTQSAEILNSFEFGYVNSGETVTERFLNWNSPMKLSPTTGSVVVTFMVTYPNFCSAVGGTSPNGNQDLFVQYRHRPSGSWANMENLLIDGVAPTTSPSMYIDYQDVLACWQGFSSVTASISCSATPLGPTPDGFKEDDIFDIRIYQSTFDGTEYDNWIIANAKVQSVVVQEAEGFLNFNPMATDGIKSFPYSASYRQVVGELMGDTDGSLFGIGQASHPSMAFNELYYLSNTSGSLEVFSDYTERLTEQISGKNPWYNTYEKYGIEVRPTDKGMSILPEFKMSDFIEYYLIDSGGNFRAQNNNFLSLPGASITSSAATPTSSVDVNFVSKFVDSSKSNRLFQVAQDHQDIATVSHIELSCKGIKKLLPYNGFYPANRTIQLGSLLSQSVAPHISGTKENSTGSFFPQALQGLLKPLVSPGILYNSIKSGIAVDYPVYTGSVPGLVEGSDSPSDFRLSSGSNYRLPFEALLNLKGTLPEGEDNPIRLVSSFSTLNSGISTEDLFQYSFTWDGDKSPLFELGMHNFLAETVDFFLEDGQLTSYKSQVQPADGWEFEANKTYYMDVVMRDTVEMNKFVEYTGSRTVIEDLKFGPVSASSATEFAGAPSMLSMDYQAGKGAYVCSGDREYYGHNAYLFHNAFDGLGWRLVQDLTGSGAYIGQSTAMTSGSDAMYALVGNMNPASNTVYQYRIDHDSGKILSVQTYSDSGNMNYYGNSVDIVSGSDAVYCAVGARDDNTAGAGAGACYLIKSSSVGGVIQTKITGSGTGAGDRLGSIVKINSGSDGVRLIASKPETGANSKAVYLFHSKSSEPFYVDSAGLLQQEWQTFISATTLDLGENFPNDLGIISGSDGIYIVAGDARNDVGAAQSGATYLFHSKSSEPFYVDSGGALNQKWQKQFTSSAPIADGNFGISVGIVSGSAGIYVVSGESQECNGCGSPPTNNATGSAYVSLSSSTGIIQQQIVPNDPAPMGFFGATAKIAIDQNTQVLYVACGAPNATYGLISGSGAGYMFTGTVGTLTQFVGIPNLQFDYKQHGKLFGMAITGEQYHTQRNGAYQTLTYQSNSQDPAYIAYTPPCFYGEAVARLSFNPGILGPNPYTLDEIFADLKVENILTANKDRMATLYNVRNSPTELQLANKMPVASSANMFGKFFQPGVTYDPQTGEATSIDASADINPAWVISTRFESPVIDVSSSKYNELYTAHNPSITATYDWENDGSSHTRINPRSMWTSYGDVPQGTKGVYFEIRESYPDELNQDSSTTGSLLQTCGFTTPEQSKSKVGKVRQTKTVSEAVVAIPYLEGDVSSVPTTLIDGKYFIKISRAIYNSQKYYINNNQPAVPSQFNNDQGDIATTTVSDMAVAIDKYVIPPHLNFSEYSDIDPFIMYFLEFEHTLDQQDLTDIWQGVMPTSALRMEKDEVMISHDVDPFNFFGGISDPTIFSKLKFFVFKVKRKAKYNYYKITADAIDDSRFNFEFAGDPTSDAVLKQGSYNWPYDFFSLVEKAQIEAKFTLKRRAGDN